MDAGHINLGLNVDLFNTYSFTHLCLKWSRETRRLDKIYLNTMSFVYHSRSDSCKRLLTAGEYRGNNEWQSSGVWCTSTTTSKLKRPPPYSRAQGITVTEMVANHNAFGGGRSPFEWFPTVHGRTYMEPV